MKKSEKIAGISFLLVAVFYIGMYALGGVSEINITDASFVKNIVLIAAFVLLGVEYRQARVFTHMRRLICSASYLTGMG